MESKDFKYDFLGAPAIKAEGKRLDWEKRKCEKCGTPMKFFWPGGTMFGTSGSWHRQCECAKRV